MCSLMGRVQTTSSRNILDKLNPITAILITLKFVQNLDQTITVAKQEEIKLRARRNEQNKASTPRPTNPNKNSPFQKKFQSQNRNPNNSDHSKKKIHFRNEAEDNVEDDVNPEEETENATEVADNENFLKSLECELGI